MIQEERFWAKVDKTPGQGPNGDCWGWLGATLNEGYGYLNMGDRTVLVHRLSYELHHGPIPEGKMIRHTCDNPPCSNPGHLLLGTQQDNMDDRMVRGRYNQGELNGRAKLTVKDVLAIRRDTRTSQQIAPDYGVSERTIRYVKARS